MTNDQKPHPFDIKVNRKACRQVSRKRKDLTCDEKALIDWDGDLASLDRLLERGVHIDTHTHSNTSNRSLLVKAVIRRDPLRVEALLERGANPNFDGGLDNTPLAQLSQLSIRTPNEAQANLAILRSLRKYGAILAEGWSQFSFSSDDLNLTMFVEEGIPFCYRDFVWALQRRKLYTCRAMAKKGLAITHDVFQKNGNPVQEAVGRKDIELLRFLLDTGHQPWHDHHAMKILAHNGWKPGLDLLMERAGESRLHITDSLSRYPNAPGQQALGIKKNHQSTTPKRWVAPTPAQAQSQLIDKIVSRTSPQRPGSVYVMSNPCMPGLVKIGYTRQGAEKRAQDLTRDLEITAVPGRFSVELEIPTPEPELLENTLHLLFCRKRAERGEFFRMTVEEVASVARVAGLID